MGRIVSLAAILCALACAALEAQRSAEPRWRMRYFYDADESTLALADFKFPSPMRGIAAGVIDEKRGPRPVALVTGDGGAKWDIVTLKEAPVSLFFLNDSLGWMVTTGGVWQTEESGRSWKKLKGMNGLLRVHFLDAQRGFAVGTAKSVYETSDGGRRWSKVAAAATPSANPQFTAYGTIAFAGQFGIIAGWTSPPRRQRSRVPDWMDPEEAIERAEWPVLAITLETRDGGRSWNQQTASVFGRISRLAMAADGLSALSLIEFGNSFEWPSEVHHLDFRNKNTTRVFREKNRAVKDAALVGSGAWLAAVEPPGKLRQSPVPGRLKMLRSENLRQWRETDVDYRAIAGRALLASPDAANVWVATDTGMILKWE